MGDLAFAKSFDTLTTGQWHPALKLLRDGMGILSIVTPVPWLAQILFHVPGAAYTWNTMIDWCKMTMGERLKNDTGKKDVCGPVTTRALS